VLRTPGLVSRENLKNKIIMEFTKEQVEYLKEEWTNSPERNFIEFANSLIKPEIRFINVKIEYTGLESTLTESSIEKAIAQYFDDKVTADVSYIPEGTWKDTDMIEFVRYFTGNDIDAIKNHFNNFKAERKSELDK